MPTRPDLPGRRDPDPALRLLRGVRDGQGYRFLSVDEVATFEVLFRLLEDTYRVPLSVEHRREIRHSPAEAVSFTRLEVVEVPGGTLSMCEMDYRTVHYEIVRLTDTVPSEVAEKLATAAAMLDTATANDAMDEAGMTDFLTDLHTYLHTDQNEHDSP